MALPDGYNSIPDFRYFEDIAAGVNSIGTTYYVDCNAGADTNDGLSWEYAFKTLSKALAASHANISAGATGWASRNRIFFKGDQSADADGENLVLWAQKTDVIGVGSTNWHSKPTLVGNHVIPATHEGHGCRFFNISFIGPAAGGDIMKFTDQHGIEFHFCDFWGNSTAAATGAILPIASVDTVIKGCRFFGAFSDAAIEVGAGQADGFRAIGNEIFGADNGIEIPATATFAAGRYGLVKDNVIHTAKICITDATNKVYVIGNRGVTDAAKGASLAGAVVCNVAFAQGNRFSTSDANNVEYPALGSI